MQQFNEHVEQLNLPGTDELTSLIEAFMESLLSSESFHQIVRNQLEEKLEEFKLSFGTRIAEAVIETIDFDDIASDIDITQLVADQCREAVENAVSGAF